MPTNTEIKFVNKSSDEDNSSVLVFMKPTESTFAAQSTAWQVIKNIGYNCWHKFTYTLDTSIVVTWDNGKSGTENLPTTNGKNYALKQTKGGYSLEESGSGNSPNEFDVLNRISTPHGISVTAYKDGNPLLTKKIVAKGEKAEFVVHPKLYFGLSSEYQVGDIVSSAVMSEDFKEISLEGLKSLTVTMTGSPALGYTFAVSDQVPA
jgi:hypothetical protein